jgi:hypothetical protein
MEDPERRKALGEEERLRVHREVIDSSAGAQAPAERQIERRENDEMV